MNRNVTIQDHSPDAFCFFLTLFRLFFTTPLYYVGSLDGIQRRAYFVMQEGFTIFDLSFYLPTNPHITKTCTYRHLSLSLSQSHTHARTHARPHAHTSVMMADSLRETRFPTTIATAIFPLMTRARAHTHTHSLSHTHTHTIQAYTHICVLRARAAVDSDEGPDLLAGEAYAQPQQRAHKLVHRQLAVPAA